MHPLTLGIHSWSLWLTDSIVMPKQAYQELSGTAVLLPHTWKCSYSVYAVYIKVYMQVISGWNVAKQHASIYGLIFSKVCSLSHLHILHFQCFWNSYICTYCTCRKVCILFSNETKYFNGTREYRGVWFLLLALPTAVQQPLWFSNYFVSGYWLGADRKTCVWTGIQ